MIIYPISLISPHLTKRARDRAIANIPGAKRFGPRPWAMKLAEADILTLLNEDAVCFDECPSPHWAKYGGVWREYHVTSAGYVVDYPLMEGLYVDPVGV